MAAPSPNPIPPAASAPSTPTPRRLSITVIVALIVVLPIIAVSSALLALAWATSARVSENLGSHVMTAAAGSVAAKIDSFLGEATRVSDRYAQRIASGTLPDASPSLGFQPWERTMFDDLSTTPAIASICYGNTRGDATWLLRGPNRLEIGRVDGARAGHALEFTADPRTGAATGDPLRVYTYDPRQRPWWSVAMSSPTPMWTPVYTWFTGNTADTTIGTGYTRQILAPDGTLRGCLVIDVTLGALNDFLAHIDVADKGRLFIIDAGGRLIAASSGEVSDPKGERYALASAPQPEAVAIAAAMSRAHVLLSASDSATLDVTIDGEPARASITSIAPRPGLYWRLVTVLPESAFMAEAHAVRTRAVIAAIVAVLASLLFGLLLSRRLSAPVVQMTEHVKRVGAGDFDARLDLHGAQELVVLSQEINRMATGLKDRMQLQHSLAVAMEVQQSLLPASDPTHSRLDAAGHSKYCDQTGGDYYDFIDVAPITPDCMLVAVGDVMGHGIAAALWMATARAAIRTEALGGAGLARLMTRTNRVLSLNNRHHRFMTLSLARIDAARRSVTWASAGHDPPIVYDPTSDTFVELEGGDVPLGVMDDVEYQEYTRQNLPAGAVIAIGTDGVWEMYDGKDRYGKDRLMAVLREHHAKTAKEIAAALDASLTAFRGQVSPEDDVTFVVVKVG